MVELTDQEKQQIFLALNNITKTMLGLKDDVLIQQTRIEQRVRALELQVEELNGPDEDNS